MTTEVSHLRERLAEAERREEAIIAAMDRCALELHAVIRHLSEIHALLYPAPSVLPGRIMDFRSDNADEHMRRLSAAIREIPDRLDLAGARAQVQADARARVRAEMLKIRRAQGEDQPQ